MNYVSRAFLQSYKTLLQNTAFVFALNTLQRIFGLAIVYVLVRALSQDQFGNYQFILSIVGVLTIFSLPGLNNAVMQSTARGMEGTFRASLLPSLLSSLIGSLILSGIGAWFLLVKGNDLFLAFFIASFLFPFAHSLNRWRAVKTGKEKFSSLFLIEGAFAILSALFIIGVVLVVPGSIIWPLLVVLTIPAIQNLIFTAYLLKKIDHEAPIEEGSIQYGIRTTLYLGLNIIANHIDKLLIYAFFSPASMALYFVAERVSEFTKGVGQNLAAILAPRFAKTDSYTNRLDKILNVFSILIGLSVIVFAFTLLPSVIEILFGEHYIEVVPVAQALLCTVAIMQYSTLKSRFVRSKLDEKSIRDITILVSLVRIVASVILTPIYGIWGAVIATSVYRISSALVVTYIIKTRYKKSS